MCESLKRFRFTVVFMDDSSLQYTLAADDTGKAVDRMLSVCRGKRGGIRHFTVSKVREEEWKL